MDVDSDTEMRLLNQDGDTSANLHKLPIGSESAVTAGDSTKNYHEDKEQKKEASFSMRHPRPKKRQRTSTVYSKDEPINEKAKEKGK